ncbi:MAG TPA: TlpA disulfide reductase family protein, partial [Longimicrobiaceae bacterium]|nr:TlpA disulfide reductase family protein [Longimicrobiaceae bacterium]
AGLAGRRAVSALRLASAALLLLAGCAEGRRFAAPEVGSPAPAYAAAALSGDTVSLDALRGKVVLLNVWATWCHPCREEIPALQELHERHAAQGLTLVGVSVDNRSDRAAVEGFAREYGMTYPVWLDPEERVSSTFRTLGVPSTFLIGRDGTILWKHVGPVDADDPTLTRLLAEALAAPSEGTFGADDA